MKADYDAIPKHMAALARKWNVGTIALWYPLLPSGLHRPMMAALRDRFPEALAHEVRFPPAREGHGLVGSGMFVVNPPWGSEGGGRAPDRPFRGPHALSRIAGT